MALWSWQRTREQMVSPPSILPRHCANWNTPSEQAETTHLSANDKGHRVVRGDVGFRKRWKHNLWCIALLGDLSVQRTIAVKHSILRFQRIGRAVDRLPHGCPAIPMRPRCRSVAGRELPLGRIPVVDQHPESIGFGPASDSKLGLVGREGDGSCRLQGDLIADISGPAVQHHEVINRRDSKYRSIWGEIETSRLVITMEVLRQYNIMRPTCLQGLAVEQHDLCRHQRSAFQPVWRHAQLWRLLQTSEQELFLILVDVQDSISVLRRRCNTREETR